MACGMVNGCATGIITKGLGLPAKNNLVFGMSRLQIKVDIVPTPTPTPSFTPAGRGGVGIARRREENSISDVQLRVLWMNGNEINKTFKVDSHWDNIMVKRIGNINTVKQRFDVKIKELKNSFNINWTEQKIDVNWKKYRFKVKWKK